MSEKIIVQPSMGALPHEVERFIQVLTQERQIHFDDGRSLEVKSIDSTTTMHTIVTKQVRVVAHTDDGQVVWLFDLPEEKVVKDVTQESDK